MRCFCHQEKEAVGACKSCGKGVCPECVVDLGKGLACRGRCEEDVKGIITLVDHNIRHVTGTALVSVSATPPPSAPVGPSTDYLAAQLWIQDQRMNRSRYGLGLFSVVVGTVFVLAGLRVHALLTLGGSCFLVFGLATLWDSSKAAKRPPLANWRTK